MFKTFFNNNKIYTNPEGDYKYYKLKISRNLFNQNSICMCACTCACVFLYARCCDTTKEGGRHAVDTWTIEQHTPSESGNKTQRIQRAAETYKQAHIHTRARARILWERERER